MGIRKLELLRGPFELLDFPLVANATGELVVIPVATVNPVIASKSSEVASIRHFRAASARLIFRASPCKPQPGNLTRQLSPYSRCGQLLQYLLLESSICQSRRYNQGARCTVGTPVGLHINIMLGPGESWELFLWWISAVFVVQDIRARRCSVEGMVTVSM
jgi:hypothetical protein